MSKDRNKDCNNDIEGRLDKQLEFIERNTELIEEIVIMIKKGDF